MALCCVCIFLTIRPEEISLVSDASYSHLRAVLTYIPDQIIIQNQVSLKQGTLGT